MVPLPVLRGGVSHCEFAPHFVCSLSFVLNLHVCAYVVYSWQAVVCLAPEGDWWNGVLVRWRAVYLLVKSWVAFLLDACMSLRPLPGL